MDDQAGIADEVRRASSAVLDDESLRELLQEVVGLASHLVAGDNEVSVTVMHDGKYHTSNATGAVAVRIDDIQYAEDGPCLEALRTGRQLTAEGPDLDRWPAFAAAARARSVVHVLSTPLKSREAGPAIGALNVYGGAGTQFADSDRTTATMLGRLASILVGNVIALSGASELNQQLREAVASREIIGTAKGILMERQSCTREAAFDILRRASQRENRKLRDLAEELVARVEARAGT